jgi:RES domain-containing protein
LRVYRIFSRRYATSALSGEGARLYGGRWNSPGASVLYAAGNLALAMLEMMANAGRGRVPPDYVFCHLDLPDDVATEVLEPAFLPVNWRESPAPRETQELGDGWVRAARSVALLVPSTIVPIEQNVLLNPAHADFARIIAGPHTDIQVDARLR